MTRPNTGRPNGQGPNKRERTATKRHRWKRTVSKLHPRGIIECHDCGCRPAWKGARNTCPVVAKLRYRSGMTPREMASVLARLGHGASGVFALLMLLMGCAAHHVPRDGAVPAQVGAQDGSRADAAPVVHQEDSGPHRGSCGLVAPGCQEVAGRGLVDGQPLVGAVAFCRADHEWVPTLAARWSIERVPAVARCRRWVLCDGLGVPCMHCAQAGPDWFAWGGSWCE